MFVRGKGAVIRGGGLSSPPAPYIEVSDHEGRALIGLGVAEIVEAASGVSPSTVKVVQEPVADQPAATGDAEAETQEPTVALTAGVDTSEDGFAADAVDWSEDEAEDAGPVDVSPAAGLTERDAGILEVFELLGDDDLVRTGARAGRPKVSAIEDATGLKDLTAAEIDPLWVNRVALSEM